MTNKKHEPFSIRQIIELGFEQYKKINHTEYLRCIDEGEDTTWYEDRWIKGKPGLDDQVRVAQSEEEMTDKKHVHRTIGQTIEEEYELDKKIDHDEYLRCLKDGEDITWYKEKYPKSKGIYDPIFDDLNETLETEEEITKELHYKE